VGTLLNLAEFCEHDEAPLPLEARTLGAIAERCRAYAKALHYKETEFVSNPAACVEAIIAINNKLQLPEAAMGVLVYAQAHLRLEIKEGWYEKLGQWENALDAYRRKAAKAEAAARDAEATADPRAKTTAKTTAVPGGGGGARGDDDEDDGYPFSEADRERAFRKDFAVRERLAKHAKEAAQEQRREATLGQMRCLAALAEWEALGRLCAREWDACSGASKENSKEISTKDDSEENSMKDSDSGSFGVMGASVDPSGATCFSAAPPDASLRLRMAPLAARAAWHLGDWRRMGTYCAAMRAPGDPAARSSETRPGDSSGGDRQGFGLIGGFPIDGDRSRSTAAREFEVPEEEFNGGGVAVDFEFFRAVLATRRGDVEEARGRIAEAREHLGSELAALVTESYDRSYEGMVRTQQLSELEEVLEYVELGRRCEALEGVVGGGGKAAALAAPLAARDVPGSVKLTGRFASTANVGDARSAQTRRELIRRMWRERIYGVQRKVEVWQALLAVRALALSPRDETETWLKFASLSRKAGRARQAHRTLLRLLEYDPSRCVPGAPGYGAGSGQPAVMLAYVKHQWALGIEGTRSRGYNRSSES
jgi:hypothetical protein